MRRHVEAKVDVVERKDGGRGKSFGSIYNLPNVSVALKAIPISLFIFTNREGAFHHNNTFRSARNRFFIRAESSLRRSSGAVKSNTSTHADVERAKSPARC